MKWFVYKYKMEATMKPMELYLHTRFSKLLLSNKKILKNDVRDFALRVQHCIWLVNRIKANRPQHVIEIPGGSD